MKCLITIFLILISLTTFAEEKKVPSEMYFGAGLFGLAASSYGSYEASVYARNGWENIHDGKKDKALIKHDLCK